MNRLPGLDLLRAVAILWVMLYHLESYELPLSGVAHYGWIGVDLFFVLSGFLIGYQVVKPYASGERLQWGSFMLRRAFRVLPAYLTVLALYYVVPAVRESEGLQPLWQFLTFTVNMFPDYFHNRAYSHAWSLCVEEHFYLLLPPIVWLLARRPASSKVAIAALVALVGGMALRGWLWQHEVAPYMDVRSGEHNFMLRYVEAIYNPTYTRLDGLLAGLMLAVVKAFRAVWWARALRFGLLFLVLGVAGIFAFTRIDAMTYAGAVFGFPLIAASLACVVVAAQSPRTWLGRYSLPGAAPIAAMSFSLYLTHKQVFHWIRMNFDAAIQVSDLLAFAAYISAAMAVAALLYVAVERPGLRLRDRFTPKADPNDVAEPTRAGAAASEPAG